MHSILTGSCCHFGLRYFLLKILPSLRPCQNSSWYLCLSRLTPGLIEIPSILRQNHLIGKRTFFSFGWIWSVLLVGEFDFAWLVELPFEVRWLPREIEIVEPVRSH